MDNREQMEQVAIARREDAVEAKKEFKEQSRKRLFRIVSTKHKTTMIGAISRFEEYIGRAWGHGLSDEQRTPEQKALLELWLKCRTDVLNNGNNQLRALEKELSLYEVEWLRYRQMLPVKSPQP